MDQAGYAQQEPATELTLDEFHQAGAGVFEDGSGTPA